MKTYFRNSILWLSAAAVAICCLIIIHMSDGNHAVNKSDKSPAANPGWNEQYLKMRQNEDGVIPVDVIKNIRQTQRQNRRSTSNLLNVQDRGPSNVGGRTRAFVVDYTDENHLLTGGVSGGMWRSTNKGESWSPVDDFAATLSVTGITQNPFDPNIFYYTTGEEVGSTEVNGDGVYKSTDGGETFTHLSTPFLASSRIKCSLSDPNTFYVTSNAGLFRSVDGGATISQFDEDTFSDPTDIEVFSDGSVIVAEDDEGIYRSPNGNPGTFELLTNGLPEPGDFGRIELAYCESEPNVMYAIMENDGFGGLLNVYKTTNGGDSWVTLTHPGEAYFSLSWYALVIGVKPDDPDKLIIGSVISYYSSDGGDTWQTTYNSHNDYHVVEFNPFNPEEIYVGNDGGIYRYNFSTIESESEDLNSGLNITQFYTGTFAQESDDVMGGTQDNGTPLSISESSTFDYVTGGDGGYCYISQQNPNKAYVTWQYGRIFRTENLLDQNPTTIDITNQLDADNNFHIDDGATFINPFAMNPVDDSQLYFTTLDRLWRSTDSGDNWEPITEDVSNGGTSTPYAIAVTKEENPTVYYGGDDGLFYRIDNAAGASPEVHNLGSPHWGFIGNISIHPQHDSIVYVAYTNYSSGQAKLFKVHEANTSEPVWTNIAGDLPNGLGVNWVEVNPTDDQFLVAATDFGVYTSIDGGNTWTQESEIPNVSVYMMRLRESDNTLYLYTHGRGIWSANLPGSPSSVAEDNGKIEFRIWPNPATDWLNIDGKCDQVEVYSLTGQQVLTVKLTDKRLDISSLKGGTYAIKMLNKGKVESAKRVVVL